MTSPFARPVPPLTSLPAPRRLPREDTALVPPHEIIAESTGALRRRLMRISWAPGLVLLGLWYVLLTLYVLGASPTYWLLGSLVSLAEPMLFRSILSDLGFGAGGLGTAYLLLPAGATLLSLGTMLLAPRWIAGIQPRRFLSESAFQQEVATRVTAALMLPPVAVVLLWPLTVVAGLPQPWSGLGAGALGTWCAALGALEVAWLLVRGRVSAPTLLGVPDAALLRVTAQIGRDREERLAAARQSLAQDRRHLPPNLGTPEAGAAATPRGAAVALVLVLRASLTWVVPAVAGAGMVVFGIADMVTALVRITSDDLRELGSVLRWQQVLITVPMLGLALLGTALAPALAVRMSRSRRAEVRDLRTYPEWAHRARMNPWEARVVTLTGWITAVWVLLALTLTAILLPLLQVATPLSWALVVTAALLLTPLAGAAASAAMRSGLRDVLYGPPGDFMRRQTPYALVAPDLGTRAQRAADPAVRAALRQRMQAAGGEHALEVFDLDAAGERLWVDESETGPGPARARADDLRNGLLPDFGSEGSAFTGGGRAPGEVPGADRAAPHGIPESVTGLREV